MCFITNKIKKEVRKTGKYKSKTIKNVVEMIRGNEMYLPAIQRKFVWSTEQIESLFDSILKGYPIGIFLFWKLNGKNRNNYTFYEFIRNYDENNANFNQPAPNININNHFFAVLDGQQRLTSLYIALQGSYIKKRKRGVRKLYLNILKIPDNTDEDYEFKFLTQDEAENSDENHIWFCVQDVLGWDEQGIANSQINMLKKQHKSLENIIENNQNRIVKVLGNLWGKLCGDSYSLINYYEVDDDSIDNILEVFVRVNSGGTKLSKSDLLFSIIVANWNDGRKEVEDLLNDINNKGSGFSFDTDFVIKASLFLNDLPIKLSANALTNNNINEIRENWEQTKSAIEKAVDLLVEFNFTNKTLTSKNAVIPIAYYYFKTNTMNFNSEKKRENKKKIENYLIRALIKHVYGGQSDSVLEKVRNTIRNALNNTDVFPLEALLNADLGTDKSLRITKEDVNEILEYRYDKQSSYTFMVLSLLYSNMLNPNIIFHQDHIHPKSFFTEANLRQALENKFNQNLLRDWKEKSNMLPNLQLLEGSENQEKSNTPFKDWLDENYRKDNERKRFLRNNFIPTNVDLSISNFDEFFEKRKKILRDKLYDIFGVNENGREESSNSDSDHSKEQQNNVAQNQINEQNEGDYRGRKKIVAFTIKGNEHKVNTWTDVLIEVCKIVLSDPNNNKKDITQVRLNGRNRRNPKQRFYRKTEDFEGKNLKPITDEIYVDTSGLNSNSFVNLSKEVLKYFGYDLEKDFQIEAKDS